VFTKDGKLFLKEDGKDFELTKLGRWEGSVARGRGARLSKARGARRALATTQ
jgi:hypothetical protein